MEVHQLQLRYVAEEDRIFFRLNTRTGEELRFWLTRRYVGLLRPVVRKLMVSDYAKADPAHAAHAAEIMDFERAKLEEQTSFKDDFEEGSGNFPLGKAPLVLAQIKVKERGGMKMLCLYPKSGSGIELPLSKELVNPLYSLLNAAIRQAQWRLPEEEVTAEQSGVGTELTVH